jgi:hypothetical protein
MRQDRRASLDPTREVHVGAARLSRLRVEPASRAFGFEFSEKRITFTAKSDVLAEVTRFILVGARPSEYRLTQDKHDKCTLEPNDKGDIEIGTDDGPDQQQLDCLRQAIVKKNVLFFHRWRPANETYLYGFRKHEQGNNGVEPPMFDKLVEDAENEIARLKKPVPQRYELVRVEEKK